ncbi:class F sortase [Candidatus Saccharibacteria bacterium]|nr:class F sortase [Candidatus Saccharibacteria bacterium]
MAQIQPPAVQPQTSTDYGLPVRISIPKINVDAPIEQVGLDAKGAMAIQESQDIVAWYEPGPRPGNTGSAVLAGHYGELNGKWSVFSYLSKLRKGDVLQVQGDNGASLSFVVRESRSYDPKADAREVFNSNDGKAHLNLITCEGTWNKTEETYSKRFVVFTDQLKQ